jgi:hypothetical protein
MAAPNSPDKPRNKPSGNPKRELKESEFVAELVPDPAQARSFTLLVGYLGKSPEEGYWRLYLNTKLNQYVDIVENDIVRSQPLPTEQSSLGAVRLWIKSNAQLSYTRVTSRQIQAEFLQGSIMRGFTPSLAGVPATIMAALRSSRGRLSINFCPTDPHSTCEDVCVATHQACFSFGCAEMTDDPGCTADAC